MKQNELRDKATCNLCKNKIGAGQLPMFFTLSMKQYVIDMQALQRHSGLEMMLNPAIAAVMGPDEDLAKEAGKTDLVICYDCYVHKNPPLAVLFDTVVDDEVEEVEG